MHNVYLEPFLCPHGAASGHGCSNPEADAPNLVVNKLVLTVDNRCKEGVLLSQWAVGRTPHAVRHLKGGFTSLALSVRPP